MPPALPPLGCDLTGDGWCSYSHNYVGTREMGGRSISCEPRFCLVTALTYTNPQTAALVASYANTVFDRCEMYFHYRCSRSITWGHGTYTQADWRGHDGVSFYWQDSPDCGAQAGLAASTCTCDQNDATWRKMEGNLTTTTYGWAAFPPSEFRNGDLGSANEYGQLTLGPLLCRLAGS